MSMAENTVVEVKKLSFERAIEELETIVKRLEDGKVPLEESVAIYERGEALKRRCARGMAETHFVLPSRRSFCHVCETSDRTCS